MQRESDFKKAATKGTDESDLIEISDERAPTAVDALLSKSKTPASSNNSTRLGSSPKATFLMRRSSNSTDGQAPLSVRGNIGDMKEHLKHLGPSNLASRPNTTRYQSVKIKPGNSGFANLANDEHKAPKSPIAEERYTDEPAPQGGTGEGLLAGGKDASDGVQALHQGYGTMALQSPQKQLVTFAESQKGSKSSQSSPGLGRQQTHESNHSSDTLGELLSQDSSPRRKRSTVRSGSITENIIDVGGIRKVILETTSSSDGEQNKDSKGKEKTTTEETIEEGQANDETPKSKKSKRRRHRKKGGKVDNE